jgi:hypothetical protein
MVTPRSWYPQCSSSTVAVHADVVKEVVVAMGDALAKLVAHTNTHEQIGMLML